MFYKYNELVRCSICVEYIFYMQITKYNLKVRDWG